MLQCAESHCAKHHAIGVFLIGDFNARHTLWGDSVINTYGKMIEEKLDWTKYSINAPHGPTFLACNGRSVIDLVLCSNSIHTQLSPLYTDSKAILFSGAPIRGHIPISTILSSKKSNMMQNKKGEEKIDMRTMDWENWKSHIESKLSNRKFQNATTMWNWMNEVIQEATSKCSQKKTVSPHSKPYWTKKLTELSKTLMAAQKRYTKRNTDDNHAAFKLAYEEFNALRKNECQQFILKKTSTLNASQSTKFWKEFNRLFKPKIEQQVDPLISSTSGDILTDNKDIEQELFETFFEAKHITSKNETFDAEFYQEVSDLYDQIKAVNYQQGPETYDCSNILNGEITHQEVMSTIKDKSPSMSFDNCLFHPSMILNLGPNAIAFITKLFNFCLTSGKWPWDAANVIFLKKEGKDSYAAPGAYRPISLTSYIGKILEKILADRLNLYLLKIGLVDPSQEGFCKGRNTVRYLNKLTSSIKGDQSRKLCILCLFIDFEKAFDSTWKKGLITKLWHVGIHGLYLRLIDSFLFSRTVSLLFNGHTGFARLCLEYGLPQGSALSPVLFRFYIHDLGESFVNKQFTDFYKFAEYCNYISSRFVVQREVIYFIYIS